jgi:hypothetical protein
MLYGYAINQIIVFRPEDFYWENYITQIGLDFPKKFELSFTNRTEIKEWLKEWNKTSTKTFENVYAETIIETQNQLRYIYQSIKQNLPVQETLKNIGCFDPSTKGSGVATVIAGIYLATKFHDKPLEAVIESVNALGSDTDSIAAFTGGLVGALHGQSIIPDKWKSVQDISYLDIIAERLLAISEDRFKDIPKPLIPDLKILNNPKKDDYYIDQAVEFIPLGRGKVTFIDRQPTLTKGKYSLLVEALFDNGQSILVSKLFDEPNFIPKIEALDEVEALIELATEKLNPKTLEKLKVFIDKQKKLPKVQIEIILALLKNE